MFERQVEYISPSCKFECRMHCYLESTRRTYPILPGGSGLREGARQNGKGCNLTFPVLVELSSSTTRSNGWCIFHWVGIVWCFASKARSVILPAENAATTDFSSVAIIVSWKGVGGTKEGETKCPAKGRGKQTNKNYRLMNNTTNQI